MVTTGICLARVAQAGLKSSRHYGGQDGTLSRRGVVHQHLASWGSDYPRQPTKHPSPDINSQAQDTHRLERAQPGKPQASTKRKMS